MIKSISGKPRSTIAVVAGQILNISNIKFSIKEISRNVTAVRAITFLSVTGFLTFS